ncbi:MAG TPA: glycine zipper 2TM domain-containing protein [Rhodanobacteraceae bacterium]
MARAVGAALGVAAVLALAGCSKAGNQAAVTPANLTMATSAATAALPPGSYYSQAPAATASGAASANTAARANPPSAPARAPADPPPPPRPQAQFARVVAVQPVTQAITTDHPQRVCNEEQVAVPVPYRDQHQIGGAVVGGVLGALAGHLIGGGRGRTLATVAGAAGGAFAGHEIQKRHQEDNATQMEERNVCHTVTDQTTSTHTVAYNVTYTLDGRAGHVQMLHAPMIGDGLPVQNGVVVVPGMSAQRSTASNAQYQ